MEFHDETLKQIFDELVTSDAKTVTINQPRPPTIGDLDTIYHHYHFATDSFEETEYGWQTVFVREVA